jgi:hypothetical protein
MFRRPTRNEVIEMSVVTAVALATVAGHRFRVVTDTQATFVARAFMVWLVGAPSMTCGSGLSGGRASSSSRDSIVGCLGWGVGGVGTGQTVRTQGPEIPRIALTAVG